MPAVLTIDQSLVDNYLSRVDRFVQNVAQFEQQLTNMTNTVKDRLAPEQKAQPNMEYRKDAAAEANSPVVTAADIDLDALLSGIDLGDMSV